MKNECNLLVLLDKVPETLCYWPQNLSLAIVHWARSTFDLVHIGLYLVPRRQSGIKVGIPSPMSLCFAVSPRQSCVSTRRDERQIQRLYALEHKAMSRAIWPERHAGNIV